MIKESIIPMFEECLSCNIPKVKEGLFMSESPGTVKVQFQQSYSDAADYTSLREELEKYQVKEEARIVLFFD